MQLFEKYGTLIERSTALIEKVSPCSAAQRQAAAVSRAKGLLQTAAKESGSASSAAHVQGGNDGGPVFTIGQDVLCEQVRLCKCVQRANAVVLIAKLQRAVSGTVEWAAVSSQSGRHCRNCGGDGRGSERRERRTLRLEILGPLSRMEETLRRVDPVEESRR
eukprot:SAG31_NODE_945_length_10834_cov_16.777084_4_plen_162_part_00